MSAIDTSIRSPGDRTTPVRIIQPHSGFEAFTHSWHSIIRDFSQTRSLGWRLFVRDTRAAYRQSLFGYVWLFLPPIATAFIWIFLNSQSLVSVETGDTPYPMFVLTGSILWSAFNISVVGMQAIMGEARSVLSKVNFPHEALVYSAICKALFNSCVPAVALVPAMFVFGVAPTTMIWAFPISFLTLVAMGSAIGLILVPLSALYMDVGRGMQLALRFGFFATPVVYTLPQSGLARSLLLLNPVTSPLLTSRGALLASDDLFLLPTIVVLGVSVLAMLLATLVFKVTIPHIIERLNA